MGGDNNEFNKKIDLASKIIVIVGSSGSGKTSLVNKLNLMLDVQKIVTTTTRQRRAGELNAKDYYFISNDEFFQMDKNNEFVETTEYSGNRYGITHSELVKYNSELCCVVTDLKGARALADNYPSRVMIFWLNNTPLTMVKRLYKRGDSILSIVKRITNAVINREFRNPSKLFIDVSFTELQGRTSTINNFGIIYYRLLVSENSHNTTYLNKLKLEVDGGELWLWQKDFITLEN